MAIDYSGFSAIDFVDDEFFRQWVCENNSEAAAFWTSFILSHPEKIGAIEEAREALIVMMRLPERNVTAKMAEQANEIRRNVHNAIHYPFLHSSSFEAESVIPKRSCNIKTFSRRRLGIAASLLAIISLTLATLSNFPKDGGNAEAQTIVQTNSKGKRSIIDLPDGTKVWLNAESQLIYSKDFQNQNTREVFLLGEAFFEVAEDKSKPFIVSTSSIAIKVLGTAFNVRSYDRQRAIETTLLRGKIGISVINQEGHSTDQEETALFPNQRAVFTKETKKLVIQNNVEAELYSGWRTGKLYFDDKPISEVLAIIEQWYNVTIHLENVPPNGCTFSAKIDNKTLAEVLELFKNSADESIAYRIKNKDVYVTGKFCQ